MDLGLKNKRALITGGTRGIGAAIVELLLREGAIVSFCARKSDEVLQREAEWKAQGFQVKGSVCDVANPTDYSAWIEREVIRMGGLDIFIPNVSGGAGQGEEGWKTAFDVDLMATVRGCETVLPNLVESKGAIVVIASIAGLEATGSASPYNTVKAGLIAYASQLGDMCAPHGIRVNSVSPGPIYIEDGFWGDVERSQPDTYKAVCAAQPLQRLGTPAEVAQAVVFLASDMASWVTRTNLIVDGGFTRRVQF